MESASFQASLRKETFAFFTSLPAEASFDRPTVGKRERERESEDEAERKRESPSPAMTTPWEEPAQ